MLTLLVQAEAAEGAGHAAGPTSPFVAPDPGLIIWTWIVFVALFVLLKKFAWPAILKATEEREQKIKAQLAEAEKLNAEAKAAVAEAGRLNAEARNQAQALLAESRAATEKDRAAAVDKTRAEQEALVERARRDIAAEKEKAIADLRREAVDLALGAAAKVVGQRLDSETDRKIVLEYLSRVEKH